ncbi:nucleotidyltransferase domain-containing protein [Paenibacillus macerans]|uniref:nucleotidyltransferase domain-containing protein n=1 Tax=Paenibacillus macerans TaxID=44252 RepID=UPI003D31F515
MTAASAGERQLILRHLHRVEREEGMKVLYACEAGSRAWAYSSSASDYDVRFIYVRPVAWYLSIADKKDVIERTDSTECGEGAADPGEAPGGAGDPAAGSGLDLVGWDLRKALSLLGKGNPALFEWLGSPVVYANGQRVKERLLALAPRVFSPKAAMYHYLNMAKRNFRAELRGERIKPKAYFYVLRPMLACGWIERYGTMPPQEIRRLTEPVLPLENRRLGGEIERLLAYKQASFGAERRPRMPGLDAYLAERIAYFEELAPTLGAIAAAVHPTESDDQLEGELDALFRAVLQDVWGLPLSD